MLADEELEAMSALAMSIEQLQDCIDRYGEDLTTWPENERLQADTLLASSEPARALLAEAEQRAVALRTAAPKAPPGLVDRILKAAGVPPKKP